MIIRSTFSSRLNYLADQTNQITAEMEEVNSRISSGLAITKPSDAPELTARIMSVEQEISDQLQFGDNATYASTLHDSADAILLEISDVLMQARELAVQMASESYSSEQRINSASEADQLLTQALSLLNTQIGERYLFSGEAYDTQPYDTTLTYQGSTDPSTINLSDDVDVVVGFDADGLGMTDILTSIETLRDALAADDPNAVQASLTGLESSTLLLSSAQSTVGMEQTTALDFIDFTDSLGVQLETQLSELQDDDMVASLVRLSELQTQYEATLALTARSQSGNLFSMI